MDKEKSDYGVCTRQCARAFLECEASKTCGDACEEDYRTCQTECRST
jgi:hypothetical protein